MKYFLCRICINFLKVQFILLIVFQTHASSIDNEDYESGKELYDLSCSICHGKNMVNTSDTSFNLREFPKNQKQRFINSVSNGKGFMPPFGDILEPEEIGQLWLFISSPAD